MMHTHACSCFACVSWHSFIQMVRFASVNGFLNTVIEGERLVQIFLWPGCTLEDGKLLIHWNANVGFSQEKVPLQSSQKLSHESGWRLPYVSMEHPGSLRMYWEWCGLLCAPARNSCVDGASWLAEDVLGEVWSLLWAPAWVTGGMGASPCHSRVGGGVCALTTPLCLCWAWHAFAIGTWCVRTGFSMKSTFSPRLWIVYLQDSRWALYTKGAEVWFCLSTLQPSHVHRSREKKCIVILIESIWSLCIKILKFLFIVS